MSETVFIDQELKQILHGIFLNDKCVFTVEPGSKIGDGYLATTLSVIVESEGKEKKQLFIKQAPKSLEFRSLVCIEEAYHREIYFYSILQPILNEISLKHTKKLFEVTPKCYTTSSKKLKEVLVFDDLVFQGYKLLRNVHYLDDNHLKMVFDKFSELHASGFILKEERPDLFQDLRKNMKEMFFHLCAAYDIEIFLIFTLDVLKEHCSPIEDKIILENFDDITSKLTKTLQVMNEIEDYCTIVHVDCWLNNLMFKYSDDTKELEDIKVLDFQMWTINSPIFDVLHIFYSNTSSEETLNNYKYYQDYYYNSLCNNLIKMNGDPSILYPREEFIKQWNKHVYYGLFFTMTALRGTMADPNTLPNLNELARNNKLGQAFIYTLPDEKEYCRRIKLILYHIMKNFR